jgi:hypothetical protein
MPSLTILHVDDLPRREVKAQRRGTQRAAVEIRVVERTPNRVLIRSHYDPGLVIEPHSHASDHAIFVLDGSVAIGDVACVAGNVVLLEKGAVFGPLVAGPDGTEMLEFYTGDPTAFPADPTSFADLLGERGIVMVSDTSAHPAIPTAPR